MPPRGTGRQLTARWRSRPPRQPRTDLGRPPTSPPAWCGERRAAGVCAACGYGWEGAQQGRHRRAKGNRLGCCACCLAAPSTTPTPTIPAPLILPPPATPSSACSRVQGAEAAAAGRAACPATAGCPPAPAPAPAAAKSDRQNRHYRPLCRAWGGQVGEEGVSCGGRVVTHLAPS